MSDQTFHIAILNLVSALFSTFLYQRCNRLSLLHMHYGRIKHAATVEIYVQQ